MEDKNRPPKKSLLYNAVIILLVIMFLNAFVFPMFTQPRVTEVTYDKFLSMLDKGEVREVALDDTSSTILFLAEVEGAEGIYRTGAWPDDDLTQRLLSHPEVSFETEIIEETSPLVQILLGWVLPYGIIFGAGYLLMRSLQKRMGGDTSLACSPDTATAIDRQVVDVVRAQHDKAVSLLKNNMASLNRVAEYLYREETITGEQFMALLRGLPEPGETARDGGSAAVQA